MDVNALPTPLVIRYPDEEYSSFDNGFLQVMGIVTRFSRHRSRMKGPGYRRRTFKREMYEMLRFE